MAARVESESVYGSSIFHDGHAADDGDLPEYVQLCRRLFPAALGDGDENGAEPEAEEGLARYLKYLMGLPLASLRMEPALLQADRQRIAKELSMLLLNETGRGESGADMFGVVAATGAHAAAAASKIEAELAQTQSALGRLEAACAQFAGEIAGLDQQARVVQRVLDQQHVIARIVELPRVMQMCVAGGFYEEAVDIAEHVRTTGDRLVHDVRDGAHVLPGSAPAAAATAGDAEPLAMTPAARTQLVGLVGGIQTQVNAEFESMVGDLCRELASSHPAATAAAAAVAATAPPADAGSASPGGRSRRASDASVGGGAAADGGHDRSMKRLSQAAKVVGILRRVGLFSEAELRMLFLRSRWQAWQQTAEALGAYAPHLPADAVVDDASGAVAKAALAITMAVAPSPPLRAQRGAERGRASMEAAAYLAKAIDAFFLWLADVEMQFRVLFTKAAGAAPAATAAGEPLTDLATFASQQFLAHVLPLVALLSEAAGVASLQALLASHAPVLERAGVGLALPALAEALNERAFASVVWGIEAAVADACDTIAALGARRESLPGQAAGAGAGWEQLAAPSRPSIELPGEFSAAPDVADRPSRFLGQFRVSPVALLQYPVLATLLGAFRDCLHALRVLVLAGDDDVGGEAPVLLAMTAVVLESELVRVADALAALHARADDHSRPAASDACAAFVFGLVRGVAEIYEEIATLSEPALAAGYGADSDDSPATLYSTVAYVPLVACLPLPARG
ncbi:hypothetical protein IWQ56_000557 [Coemansia nantahalensis]|nr:hypothetical protein IWQ56_000557 [Coemansia nantahalensis]